MSEDKVIYEPAVTSHWKQLHGNKRMLLGSQNLNPGEELVMTIAGVEADQEVKGAGGRKDTVSFLKFEETDLPMCLNITNSKTIAGLYGDYTDGWIGKKVQIFSTKIEDRKTKEIVDALRIKNVMPADPKAVSKWTDKVQVIETLEALTELWGKIPKELHGAMAGVVKAKKQQLTEVEG